MMEQEQDDWDSGYAIHASKRLGADVAAQEIHSEATPAYRNVGVFSLLIIAFFWASGGIYGNEVVSLFE